MKFLRTFILLLLVLFCLQMEGARTIRIYGYVTDSDNTGIELANVFLKGTTTGTTTNRNGYYDLQAAEVQGAYENAKRHILIFGTENKA